MLITPRKDTLTRSGICQKGIRLVFECGDFCFAFGRQGLQESKNDTIEVHGGFFEGCASHLRRFTSYHMPSHHPPCSITLFSVLHHIILHAPSSCCSIMFHHHAPSCLTLNPCLSNLKGRPEGQKHVAWGVPNNTHAQEEQHSDDLWAIIRGSPSRPNNSCRHVQTVKATWYLCRR